MNTTTTQTLDTYKVENTPSGYIVLKNGEPLRDGETVRVYSTPNAARKRISRSRRGDFHA